MPLNEMKTEDVVLLYEQLYESHSNETLIIGEKDFFEFIKRANRDLTGRQRYKLLNRAIEYIKKGEVNG